MFLYQISLMKVIHMNINNSNKPVNRDDRHTRFEQQLHSSTRNLGIDLLRIISMFMVVILHVLGQGGILNSAPALSGSWVLYWLLESLCFCAVNCFGIISGYVSRREILSIRGCFLRWAQVAFYSVLLTLLVGVIFPNTLSVRHFLGSFFPVTTQKYWYFTAYFALMFFTPFLNQFLNRLTPQKADQLIITIVMLLCLFPLLTGRDLYYLRGGYTFLWLCSLYLLGGCFRKRYYHDVLPQSFLMLGYMLYVLTTVGSKVMCTILQDRFQYSVAQLDYLFTYTSPTVLGAAAFLFLLFRNISMRGDITKRMIKFCSPLSFGVYLIHTHPSVWNNLLSNRFSRFANYSSFFCILLVLFSSVAIFSVCIVVDFLRYALFRRLKLT